MLEHNRVNLRRQVGAQLYRTNFRSVGSGEGLEYTPGNTAEDLTDEQHGQALGEEDDKDKAKDKEKGTHDGPTVADGILDNTCGKEAENLTHVGAVIQSRSPGGWDDVRSIGLADAIAILELRQAVEIGKKDGVVALHDNCSGEEDGPTDCFGILPDRLGERLGLLEEGSAGGIFVDLGEVWIGYGGASDNAVGGREYIGVSCHVFYMGAASSHGG